MRKNETNLLTPIVLSLSLAATVILFQNCGGTLKGQVEESSLGGGVLVNNVVMDKPATGINTFESIYSNLKVISGIENRSCQTVYEEGKNSLPQTNDILTYGAAAQAATVKLAACLCRQALADNQARQRLIPGVDLSSPASAMSAADQIATGLMNAAWGQNNANVPEGTKDLIAETVETLLSASSWSTATMTYVNATPTEAAFGACVTVLGSAGTNIL